MTVAVKVIGLGSPFGADQAGWWVARRLRRASKLAPYLDKELLVLEYDRPGTALLEALGGCEQVYLIDAVLSEAAVGTVCHWPGEALATTATTLSSHGWGVRQVLELAKVLGELPPALTVYGITVGEGLESEPAVLEGVAEAASRLETLLLKWFLTGA